MVGKKHNNKVRYMIIGVILVLIIVISIPYLVTGPDHYPEINTCSTSTEYSCSGISLSNSGLLNFTFIQNTSNAEYNATLYFTTGVLNTTNSNYTTSIYLGSELPSGQPIKISVQLKPDMLQNLSQNINYAGWAFLSYNSNANNSSPNKYVRVAGIIVFSRSK